MFHINRIIDEGEIKPCKTVVLAEYFVELIEASVEAYAEWAGEAGLTIIVPAQCNLYYTLVKFLGKEELDKRLAEYHHKKESPDV